MSVVHVNKTNAMSSLRRAHPLKLALVLTTIMVELTKVLRWGEVVLNVLPLLLIVRMG